MWPVNPYSRPTPLVWAGDLVLLLSFIALFCFAAGFSAAQLNTFLEDAPVLDKRTGSIDIEGRVVSLKPRNKNRRIAP